MLSVHKTTILGIIRQLISTSVPLDYYDNFDYSHLSCQKAKGQCALLLYTELG